LHPCRYPSSSIAMARMLGALCFALDGASRAAAEQAAAGEIVLATFEGQGSAVHHWTQKNDPVMGGKSTGTFSVTNGAGVFDGEVVDVPFLKAPGFIKAETDDAVASKPAFPDISSCKAIAIVAKASSGYEGFRFSFGTAQPAGGKFFASGYKAHFVPSVGEFGTVELPLENFTDFWDDATGEPIKTCQEDKQYCPDTKTLQDMRTMSVWAEGVGGKVHLEIQTVKATGCDALDVFV